MQHCLSVVPRRVWLESHGLFTGQRASGAVEHFYKLGCKGWVFWWTLTGVWASQVVSESPTESNPTIPVCKRYLLFFFFLDFRPARSNNLYFGLLHILLKNEACQILRNERKWDNLTPELTWACLLSFLSILPSHVLCGSPFTLTKETTDVSFLFLEYMTPLEQLCHLSCQIFSSAQYVRLFRKKITRFLILAA